jgi:hypothetical protein
MKKLFKICCLSGLLLAVASCDKEKDKEKNISRMFTVTVQNVSTPGLINTPRAMGAVPLSPGAWAIFTGNDPMFTEGKMADIGTERIAEDGAASTKDAAMGALSNVRDHGIFKTAAGPLLPGESAQFSFNASPGDRLQFETMFVQSNDWFYSFSGGIGLELFNAKAPVTGDVTSALKLYDAGTEADTPPGTGPDQKPVQATDNQGPTESVVITRARVRHPTFTIPATNAVIKVTITAN